MLWTAIRDIQRFFPYVVSVVYTGDTNSSKEQILAKVKVSLHGTNLADLTVAHYNDCIQSNFDITINSNRIVFVFLQKRYLVEDDRYSRLTLLGQSLGSLFLGYEALSNVVPDVFFGMCASIVVF